MINCLVDVLTTSGLNPYILGGKYVGNWQYFIGKYKMPFVCCDPRNLGAIQELPLLLFGRKDYLFRIDN